MAGNALTVGARSILAGKLSRAQLAVKARHNLKRNLKKTTADDSLHELVKFSTRKFGTSKVEKKLKGSRFKCEDV